MKLNTQPIEKRISRDDGAVEVHSIFYTIQGEGPFCGTPAVFVRLAGCNLQCPMCDTEYSDKRKLMDAFEVLAEVSRVRPAHLKESLVVITGGEPFRQNLQDLLHRLTSAGYYVQIETNGTLAPSDFHYNKYTSERYGAYVVCSPKSGKVNKKIWEVACCAKYVLCAGDRGWDGLPLTALGHTANPHLARPPEGFSEPIYLQPADEQDEFLNQANIAETRESCLQHGYILQLQIHKIIGVE
jgi:7-carboxy-7-deazaguanine synthase